MNKSRLLPNPHAYADRVGQGTDAALVLFCPRRDRELSITKVLRREEPALYDELLHSLESDDGLHWEDDEILTEQLAEIGLLLTPEQMPADVRFACFLDDGAPALDTRGTELHVNPTLSRAGALVPEDITEHLFLQGYPLAWIEAAGSGLRYPYWINGVLPKYMEALRPGAPAPALPADVQELLLRADILLPAGAYQARQDDWSRRLAIAHAEFQERGYCVVRGLVPPALLTASRRYYRERISGGFIKLGDQQCPSRYAKYNEDLAQFYHRQLAGLMQRITGEPIAPSFCFFASYLAGSSLRKHTDRPACEFSISLLLDFVPEPGGPSGWPLYLERAAPNPVQAAVDLGLGDALFYKGRELSHWRDPLPQDSTSTSFFLHYVPQDFRGTLA